MQRGKLLERACPRSRRPQAYAAAVLSDARPACILATPGTAPAAAAAARAAALPCPVVTLPDPLPRSALRGGASQAPPPPPPPPDASSAAPGDERAAYVIYTSGSTGEPKGVVGTASGILNRVAWGAGALPFRPGDAQALRTHPCFVDAVAELLCPLLGGAPVVLVPPAADADPALLLRALAAGRATRLTAVPSLLSALLPLLGGPAARPHSLRLIVSSGEPLEWALWRSLTAASPGLRVVNIYGSTEVAADATFFDPAAEDEEKGPAAAPPGPLAPPPGDPGAGWVPAGLPIDGAWAAIVGAGGEPVREAGEVGELIVGGAGVALGYYLGGRPHLPPERFGRCERRGRFHFTGDLASWHPRGYVRLHGRADLQVKVRGQRVDLGGLEAAAKSHPRVAAAAARLWDPPPGAARGDGRVALFAELKQRTGGAGEEAAAAAEELRAWLAERVPPAASPSAVVVLGRLPRTPAGKVARGALPEPDWAAGAPPAGAAGGGEAAHRGGVQPGAELVESLCDGFAAVLGRRGGAPGGAAAAHGSCCSGDFFAMGGTSVSAAALCGALGIGAPWLRFFFSHPRMTREALTERPAGLTAGSHRRPADPARPPDAAAHRRVGAPAPAPRDSVRAAAGRSSADGGAWRREPARPGRGGVGGLSERAGGRRGNAHPGCAGRRERARSRAGGKGRFERRRTAPPGGCAPPKRVARRAGLVRRRLAAAAAARGGRAVAPGPGARRGRRGRWQDPPCAGPLEGGGWFSRLRRGVRRVLTANGGCGGRLPQGRLDNPGRVRSTE